MSYPNLLRRYLASVLDLVVIWTAVFAAARVPGLAASPWAMLGIAVLVVLLYEPFATAYFCTIGQALMGIRVRTSTTLERIGLGAAYLRVATKYVLGGISLLTVPARHDRRAMHDLAADTIVIGVRATARIQLASN